MRHAEEIPHIVKPFAEFRMFMRNSAQKLQKFCMFLRDAEFRRCCAEFRMVDAEI